MQVRCLLEGISEDDILQNWHTILPESMQRWHLDRKEVLLLEIRSCGCCLYNCWGFAT